MTDPLEIETLRAIYAKISRIAPEKNEPYRRALARMKLDRSSIGMPVAGGSNPTAGSNVVSFIEAIARRRKRAIHR